MTLAWKAIGAVLAVVLCAYAAVAAQSAVRGADGAPDLSGVWMMSGSRYYIPEQLPAFQPGGDARFNARHAEGDDPSGLKCAPFGIPRQIFAPYPMQIVQAPGQVVVLYEFEHFFRVLRTNGGDHPVGVEPTFMGYAVARWDGDTLVVDTVGLDEHTWFDRSGHMHSDALHVVERYRRSSAKTMDIEVTIDDPKIFTKPWTVLRQYALQPNLRLGEYVCEPGI